MTRPAAMPQSFPAARFLAALWAMDAELVKHAFPPTSPWWRQTFERFFRSRADNRKLRRLVLRVGRRGGKSSTLCRLAVCWAVAGHRLGLWAVPPGDVGVVAFVSTTRDEANQRLRLVEALLTALNVRHRRTAEGIELSDVPCVFKVFVASVQSVVGFTAIALIADEQARWESRDSAANPALEVMGSLRPTTATQRWAFEVGSSSPWGTDDFHHESFERGDDEHQHVAHAPSWTANPTLTEEQTHELEPDPRVWSREYAAIPGATLTSALDPADLAECFRTAPTALHEGWLTIDASSLRGDAFAYAAGTFTPTGEIVVLEAAGWEGEALRNVSMASVVERIAERAKRWKTSVIFGDQREEAALTAMFVKHGIELRSYAWSEPSKDRAMQLLRRLMRERRVFLPEHERLRRELSNMKARMVPSGRIRYETNGLDYASCLITLAHAIDAEDLQLAGPETPDYERMTENMKRFLIDAGMDPFTHYTN